MSEFRSRLTILQAFGIAFLGTIDLHCSMKASVWFEERRTGCPKRAHLNSVVLRTFYIQKITHKILMTCSSHLFLCTRIWNSRHNMKPPRPRKTSCGPHFPFTFVTPEGKGGGRVPTQNIHCSTMGMCDVEYCLKASCLEQSSKRTPRE